MNCATRRARGFVVQGDQLYHRVGQNYAGWWRAVVTNATGVHTTYGPYATAITGDAIAWTSFGASPGWFGAPAGTNATPYRDIYNDRVAPVVALFRLMAAGDLGDSAVVDIDVNALNINTGAREVLATHGDAHALVRVLRESGLDARELQAGYGGDES